MYVDDDDDQIPNSYSQRPITQAINPPPLDDPEVEEDINDVKPKILLFGLRRSGKTSIRKVVFHKMSANETIFLESTTKLEHEDVSKNCFIDYVIYDFPGQVGRRIGGLGNRLLTYF
ncbi:ras-related GTP-binding protein D-like [Bolinopsis microptera]|uniref:ras-related GTP-binding protein D-like n=1 Tax=Bolinopsis microptera TaxID=2820187 RepID=UPI00307AA36B